MRPATCPHRNGKPTTSRIADASVAFLNDLVLYNGDVGMVREVSRCLSNLAANHATHDVVLDSDSSVALVELRKGDAVVARFATVGLLNLATSECCSAHGGQGGCGRVSGLAGGGEESGRASMRMARPPSQGD